MVVEDSVVILMSFCMRALFHVDVYSLLNFFIFFLNVMCYFHLVMFSTVVLKDVL